MRTILIEMNKAQQKRLGLLRAPEDLPLPLDPEALGPLGVRFSGRLFCLTHEGRDLAYAHDEYDEDAKAVPVTIFGAESAVIDGLVRRVFARLTHHLNQVGKVLAAEKREENRRALEEIEKAAAERLEEQARVAERVNALRGEGSNQISGVSWDDLVRMSGSAQSGEDPCYISNIYGRQEIRIQARGENGATASLKWDGTRVVLTDNRAGFHAERLIEELRRMTDRHARLEDPAPILAAIRALPAADLDIRRAAMWPEAMSAEGGERRFMPERVAFAAGNGVEIRMTSGTLRLYREGVCVLGMSLPHRPSDERPVLRAADAVRLDGGHFTRALSQTLEEADYQRLGAFWLSEMRKALPEENFSVYEEAGMAALETTAATLDAGYW